MNSTRIVIAGAGIAGLSTAYFLGQRGITSVNILESESGVASHASGRNSGMLHHYHPNHSMRRNLAWSVRLLKLYHLRNPDVEFLQDAPSLWLFPGDVKEELEAERESYGNWRAVAPENVPAPLKPEHVPDDACWIRFEDDGLLEPCWLTSSLRNDLHSMGIEISIGNALRNGRREDGTWHLTTERGQLQSETVVNAAGAWADPVGTTLGASPKQCTPESRFLFYTDAQVLGQVEYGFFWDCVHSTYFRSSGPGTLICVGDSRPGEPGVLPDRPNPGTFLHDRLSSDYPQYQYITPVDHRACQRTFTPDRLPYVRTDPDVSGLIWTAGLGGHGMTGSMWAGQRTADLVEAEMTE